MTALQVIITVIGATYTAAELVRFVEWIDTPRKRRKG